MSSPPGLDPNAAPALTEADIALEHARAALNSGYHLFSRMLMILAPDGKATALIVAIALMLFGQGILEMLYRHFDLARLYLNGSVGVMAYLFLLKFLSQRANIKVAEENNRYLREQAQHARQREKEKAANRKSSSKAQEAAALAQEKAEMTEALNELKVALSNIDEKSPVRPKYEATVEMMERVMQKY